MGSLFRIRAPECRIQSEMLSWAARYRMQSAPGLGGVDGTRHGITLSPSLSRDQDGDDGALEAVAASAYRLPRVR